VRVVDQQHARPLHLQPLAEQPDEQLLRGLPRTGHGRVSGHDERPDERLLRGGGALLLRELARRGRLGQLERQHRT